MKVLHLFLVLFAIVSSTSGVLRGASRGQEQDLRHHRHLRIASCFGDKEVAHGSMNSSKMARERQGNQEAKSKSGYALKSESGLHRSHLLQEKEEEEQLPC